MKDYLTTEQLVEFVEQMKALKEGRLFTICSSCGNGYRVTSKGLMPTMCDECLKGVVIPTFDSQSVQETQGDKDAS